MQVQPLLPSRNIFIDPSAWAWTTVALAETDPGAAASALSIGSEGAAGALGIVVGAVVDGVPETIIFGISLARGAGVSLAFIAAVFVSNIPQAIAPSADLAASGWSRRRVALLWTWVLLACGVASVAGYGAGVLSGQVNGARMAGFACGGILAMLSNSLLPFAAERAPAAGFWTVLGFCASFAMS